MNDRHLEALQKKHQNIDNAITTEENRPFSDENLLHSLKKQKLVLKDQMEQLLQSA